MSINLGDRSRANLSGVHPDLVRVVWRAAMLAHPEQDFTVIQGLRSHEDMCVNWGKGRTVFECEAHGVPAKYAAPSVAKVTWLNNPFASNHAPKADGYGHAVDLAPFPIDWKDLARFKALAVLMKAAAHQEGVKIGCGSDWAKSPDYPHYELVK